MQLVAYLEIVASSLSIYSFLFIPCDRFTARYSVSLLQVDSPKENAELS